jgi:hypothetical protein
MTGTKLIALSGKIGSGKSYAAQYLIEVHGFTLVKFASPLKDMLRAVGLSDDHIEGYLKEQPCDLLCGKTPRWAMQSLGTEWGRDLIGADFWVELWKNRALSILSDGGKVVADDVRFSNEREAVRQMQGAVARVELPTNRPAGESGEHASERFEFQPDFVIENHLGTDTLERALDFIATQGQ